MDPIGSFHWSIQTASAAWSNQKLKWRSDLHSRRSVLWELHLPVGGNGPPPSAGGAPSTSWGNLTHLQRELELHALAGGTGAPPTCRRHSLQLLQKKVMRASDGLMAKPDQCHDDETQLV